MGPKLACYLGPTWVSFGSAHMGLTVWDPYWRAHMGNIVYITHWANMGLLSGPHVGSLWAFPYGLVHMLSG